MHLSTKTLSIALLTGLLALPAASPASPIGDPGKARIVATVNGKEINEWTLKSYAQQRGLPPEVTADGPQRDALIEELINRELIYQNAVSIGVDKTPAVQAEIEHLRINIIAGAMLNRSSDRFAVDEAEMKKEYESRQGELSGTEYKARHILVASEHEAKAIIEELNQGGDFTQLASEHSTGPSATSGGDLGWFRAEQMMQPFGEAVKEMKKGAYSKTPVKTNFGWHIILLEDERRVAPPPYDSIKEQIRVGLQNQLMENYIADLRKEAKIEKPSTSHRAAPAGQWRSPERNPCPAHEASPVIHRFPHTRQWS